MSGGSSHEQRHYIGVDVQIRRGLAVAVMDKAGRTVDHRWQAAEDPPQVIETLAACYPGACFAIDAPRCPLPAPRRHYWTNGQWRARKATDRGHGRHCEVVVSACALARPQWTPLAVDAPNWMTCGFGLFEACRALGIAAEEVFPSAAYTQLADDSTARVQLSWKGFAAGPKDMLDATMAAYSLREFAQGRGGQCGNGDGLGRIVLPRPVLHPSYAAVQSWPGSSVG